MLDLRSPRRAAGALGASIALAFTLAQRPSPACAQGSALPPSPIEIVLDASGGMRARLGDVEKMALAKAFVRALRSDLAADGAPPAIGLRVMGGDPSRPPRDCRDTRLAVRAGDPSADAGAVLSALEPHGAAPLAFALERALADTARTYVLVTQGLDTCGGDACAVWERIVARGSNREARLHVVAIAPDAAEAARLRCLSRAGSGAFLVVARPADVGPAAARLALILKNQGRLDVRLTLGGGESFAAPVRLLVPRTGEVVAAFSARGPRPVPAGIYTVVVETAPPLRFDRVMVLPGETVSLERSDFGRLDVQLRDDQNRPLRAPLTVRAAPRGDEVRYASTGEALVFQAGGYDLAIDLGDSLALRPGVTVVPGRTTRVALGGRGTVRVISPEIADPPPTRVILGRGAYADTMQVGEARTVPAGRYRLRVETMPVYVSDEVAVGYGETTTVELPPVGTLRFEIEGAGGSIAGIPAHVSEPLTRETYGVVLSGERRLVMPGVFRLELETVPPQAIEEVAVLPGQETVVERRGISRIVVVPPARGATYRLEIRRNPGDRPLAEVTGPAPSVAAWPGSYHARVVRGTVLVWEGRVAVAPDKPARIDLPRP
jgi:hypothetical protein